MTTFGIRINVPSLTSVCWTLGDYDGLLICVVIDVSLVSFLCLRRLSLNGWRYAIAQARTKSLHATVVHLGAGCRDQCQSNPQTSVPPAERTVDLHKKIEDQRKRFRGDRGRSQIESLVKGESYRLQDGERRERKTPPKDWRSHPPEGALPLVAG